MLPPLVLYQKSHISIGLPTLTSLLMLIPSNHLPRNNWNWEFRHFLVPCDFTTVLRGDLACQSACGFLKAYIPEVSATQEGNQEMSKFWEGSHNHLESYIPVTPFYNLLAPHPVRVTVGPWHLWDVSAHLQHTAQRSWGPQALLTVTQEDLQNKLCPVSKVQN